jgi:hypothetical protein
MRWYLSIISPFVLIGLFVLWYCCVYIFYKCMKPNTNGTNSSKNIRGLQIVYGIIVEAAVNVLLIGVYKTVASTTFRIYDCTGKTIFFGLVFGVWCLVFGLLTLFFQTSSIIWTAFTDIHDRPIVSKLILDHNIVCPHSYFYYLLSSPPAGYENVDPTPAVLGALVCFLWCVLPFVYINYSMVQAVKNAEEGGLSIEELLQTNQHFRTRFSWGKIICKFFSCPFLLLIIILCFFNFFLSFFLSLKAVNKYRTYTQPWETAIVGDDKNGFIITVACVWETFNAFVKLTVVASATLMYSEMRRTVIIIVLSVSIFSHWMMRPYRDLSCNIMVVMFCICDLLGILSSSLVPQELEDVSNKGNYTAVSPENEAQFAAILEEATLLQTIFLIFALCTMVTAFAITFVSCIRMLRATQKAFKMESIRRQVEHHQVAVFHGACSLIFFFI